MKKTLDPNEIVLDPNGILYDYNEIGIYLNEAEFYALFIGNLIYVHIKKQQKFSFNE